AAHWRQVVEQLPMPSLVRSELHDELDNTARLCRWNIEQLLPTRGSRRGMSYEELEGAIDEGHPYHPCFKARTGFSLADHERYGPEAGHSFLLRWLAIGRPHYWA